MVSPVRTERTRLGLEATELAAVSGVSHSTISLLESGKLARLPGRLEAALVRFGVDLAQLRVRHAEFVAFRRQELERQALRALQNEQ